MIQSGRQPGLRSESNPEERQWLPTPKR
jgi:hypothetical protein